MDLTQQERDRKDDLPATYVTHVAATVADARLIERVPLFCTNVWLRVSDIVTFVQGVSFAVLPVAELARAVFWGHDGLT